MKVNILDVKNRLSSLIVAAERDEEVVLARNGVPVAKIVKYTAPKVARPVPGRGESPIQPIGIPPQPTPQWNAYLPIAIMPLLLDTCIVYDWLMGEITD